MKGVLLYIGNAAKWEEKNFYNLSDKYDVSVEGHIYDKNGNRLAEFIYKGYYYVTLNINGKEKMCKVHRIVACSYPEICGNFNEVVNHLDENKLNNNANNLRWVTNKENLEWGMIKERTEKTNKLKMDFYHTIENVSIPNFKKAHKKNIVKGKNCFICKIGNGVFYSVGFSSDIDKNKSYIIINDTIKMSLLKIEKVFNNGKIDVTKILC